jgi:4a-hydroxytetrahydrobiopterin dehydratase
MSDDKNPIPRWLKQDLPPTLSQRYEFENYAATRRFLDDVAKLSEQTQLYPNLSFGKNYVGVTIDANGQKISAEHVALAQKIDELFAGNT